MEEKSGLPKYIFNWKGTAALIGGGLIPTLLLGSIAAASLLVLKKDIQYSDFFLILSNTLMWSGAIWAFDYLVCRPETGKKLNFNFSTTNFYTYLLVFPMLFGMMCIAETISSQIPITGPFFGEMYDFYADFLGKLSSDIALMIVLAVIMAPIFEEIVFRGIIQKGLINGGMKPQSAIWISALVFGLVHGNPWQFIGAVLLGYVLGIVYYKTKSILLPILMHAFNNLCSTLLITYTNKESFAEAFQISEWALFGIGLFIFGSFYFLFMKRYRVHYKSDE